MGATRLWERQVYRMKRSQDDQERKGRLVDMLICTGSVHVYNCRRDRRVVVAFWVFVGAALLGCILAAVL